MKEVPRGALSKGISNQELFVWALFLLGGADRDVDVEDIYLKCFEVAPLRLSWRTRSDLPDYKKTSKALQSVEANSDFILRPHRYARRLSPRGIEWISENETRLRRQYSDELVPPPLTNQYVQQARRIRTHQAWAFFKADQMEGALTAIASALECSPASPDSIWQGRLAELSRISEVLNDEDMSNFRAYAEKVYRNSRSGS
jgi:hypothetical protein